MGCDHPEKIFVSAGFDAHREDGDPWISGRLMKLTDRRAGFAGASASSCVRRNPLRAKRESCERQREDITVSSRPTLPNGACAAALQGRGS
jgi:hypothetical protein